MKYCPQCRQSIESGTDASTNVCPVCGASLSERNLLKEGTDINGFSIVREIGHGGMGIVYLAKQQNLERYVAVKVLENSLTGDREFVDGFFREARAAASLSHPNIVQAYDAGITADGIHFFVMELIDGMNLDQVVVEHGAMELGKGLEVASKISAALKYSWDSQNLCHGDIKPENIILKSNGEIKLADLGLARDYRKDLLRPGEIMATPAYAPPEVIRAEFDKLGFKSDMYSFGATLYHLFSGSPPFPGDDPIAVCELQLNSQPKPLIALNPAIPSRLSILVDHLMEKSPSNRPASWDIVCEEINFLLEAYHGPEDKTEEVPTSFSVFRSKHKLLLTVLLVFLLFLAVCGCAFFCFFYPKETPREFALETEQYVAESPSDMAERSARSKAKARWNRLRKELDGEETGNAIQKIRNFIRECRAENPNCVPEEVSDWLAELSKKQAFEIGEKQFITLRTSLLIDCRAKKGLRNNSTKEEINTLLHRIDLLFSRLPVLKKQSLVLHIKEEFLSQKEQETIQKYQTDLNSWNTHLLNLEEQQRKRRIENEKNRKDAVEKFDSFMEKLPSVDTLKEAREFQKQLDEFTANSRQFLTPDILNNIQLLSFILQPDAFEPEPKLFAKMKHLFVKKEFSPSVFPDKIFVDTTEKGLVYYEKDSPRVQRLIPWDELRAKEKGLFFNMCYANLFSMNQEEQHLFFRVMLFKKKSLEFCKNLLSECDRIPKQEKERLADAMELLFQQKN